MNIVFIILVSVSLVMLTTISPDNVLPTMITGATNGLKLGFTLLPIYAIWLSVLELIEKTGLDNKLAKLFRPIIKLLFKDIDKKTENYLSVNLTANFLGMGGAGTNAGINAIKSMDKGYTKATDNMIMLFVISCTSIQLIPTTIIALRGVYNSQNPADIILPSLINTAITTLVGVVLAKVCSKR